MKKGGFVHREGVSRCPRGTFLRREEAQKNATGRRIAAVKKGRKALKKQKRGK